MTWQMFRNDQEHSEMIWNIQKRSGMFRNNKEYPDMIRDVQKWWWMFRNEVNEIIRNKVKVQEQGDGVLETRW